MPEELYIEMPRGFKEPGKVCLLNQALEGTKQAAYLWQTNLNEFLVNDYGMTRSSVDPCLYRKETENGKLILIVWVDDIAVATETQEAFEHFYNAFSTRWRTKRIDNMDKFIGIEINRDKKTESVTIKQSIYIEKLYKRHLSERNTKQWKTPVGTSREQVAEFEAITHAATDEERAEMMGKSMLQLLGGLLFATCMTRPDVAYAVAFLCQFMQDASPQAYNAGLGILAYMYETRFIGITFCGPGAAQPKSPVPDVVGMDGLICYSDSSFGKTPYPFGGGCIMHNGGVIGYFSRKIKFPVPDSSCYAELNIIVCTLKEGIFGAHVLEDMFGKALIPIGITDNKAAFDITKNPGVTKHAIHFERWIYFARESYLHGRAKIVLTGTANMMADGMTKVVDKTKFFLCRNFTMNI
jgi:hypothetical protein